MTKKMQKIVKEYEKRLNTVVFLYETDIIDFDKAKTEMKEEQKMFEEMRSSMYRYHLISEADFTETIHTAFDQRHVAFEKLLDMKYPTTA